MVNQILELGERRNDLVIGEVVAFNIADEIYANGRIDMHKFRPLARLGGPNYARLGEIITMPVVGNPGPRATAEKTRQRPS
jgi:flavin reductase (DIM6/NTAB) family NADH-FMN oxidoreductase RutF